MQRHARIFGRRGVRLRQQIKREEPLCPMCRAKGRLQLTEEVHHIVPLSQGGSNERSNLQALCIACHAELTTGYPATGIDGWPDEPRRGDSLATRGGR